jgi:hypothetical protein
MSAQILTSDATLVGERTPANVTDGPFDNSKTRHDATKHSLFAGKVKFHQAKARDYRERHSANSAAIQELSAREGETRFQRDQIIRSYRQPGVKMPEAATAEVDAEIEDIKSQKKERSEKRFPSSEYAENMIRQFPRFNNGKWKLLSTTYHVGDKRPPNEIRMACVAFRKAAERKLEFEHTRPRHEDDASRDAIADLRRRAKRGEPSVAMLLLGFTINPRTGAYQPNRNAEIEFPVCMSRESEFHTPVPVDATSDTSVWLQLEEYEKKTLSLIKAKASPDAIRDKDRPAAIAKAKAELLAAQHAEEAANQMCEREGFMVFRPSDWPVEVLLGAEPDSSPKAAEATPVVEESDFEEAATE